MSAFWTSARIGQALDRPIEHDLAATDVVTDTRTLVPGTLFVALEGERFDAHAFLDRAAERGALAAVVRRGTPPTPGLPHIEVEDTLVALGRLARERRRAVRGPVVAVTGTNGKTSIKELLSAALGTRWNVHATVGNNNNLIGVPLTILSTPPNSDALVVEAGSSEPGEIARLRNIIEPSIGVVSNVSSGHLQGLGTVDGVLREKTALLDRVSVAVVGTSPPALATRARELADRVVVAGLSATADMRPDDWGVDDDGHGWCVVRGTRMELPIIGSHQLDNLMIALGVAAELDLDLSAIAEALETVSLPPGRCEVIRRGDLVILQDAYNANPESMAASLATAQSMRGDRPLVVVLGSMLELGPSSARLHEEVADSVMAMEPQLIAVTGAFVPAFERHADALGASLLTAVDPVTLGRALQPKLSGREFVLVKASRGVRLEGAIPPLLSSDGAPCSTTC